MSGGDLVLGIDVGTTGAKALLVDPEGAVRARAARRYGVRVSGLTAEQDAEEWRDAVVACVRACIEAHPTARERVRALCVTAQGGAMVALDASGSPLAAARSWLDQRAEPEARRFAAHLGAAGLRHRTGWPPTPSNTGPQIGALRREQPDLFDAAAAFADTAAFLYRTLTGELVVDRNVAGITQMLDIERGDWDGELLELIGVEPDRLPRLIDVGSEAGGLSTVGAALLGLPPGTPVIAGGQDQFAAALGAGVLEPGEALISTGTAWVLLGFGPRRDDPSGTFGTGRHLTGSAWGAFGEVSSGGLSLEWARRTLAGGGPLPSLSELDARAQSVPRGAEGLGFVPRLHAGEPHLLGFKATHDARHVVRAVMEGVALEFRALWDRYLLIAEPPKRVVVAGGGARSAVWPSMLAELLERPIEVGDEPDAAAYGAAMLATPGGLPTPATRSVLPEPEGAVFYRDLVATRRRGAST